MAPPRREAAPELPAPAARLARRAPEVMSPHAMAFRPSGGDPENRDGEAFH